MRIQKETLKDGTTRYLARPIIDGKKLAVRATTKRDLERKVAALKERQHRRRLGLEAPTERLPDITYGQLVDKVLETYKHSEQSRTTLAYNLRRSRKRFERSLVRDLDAETIDAWLSRLPLAPTTKRHTLKAMRYALARALTWSYVTRNVAQAVEMPPEIEYAARPFDTWQEVRSVASAFENRHDTALVLFACATGLRPQEWQALEWRDIDRSARTLRVNRTVRAGKVVEAQAKTRGSLRAVLLSDLALEALDLLPTPLRRDQLVFPGPTGDVLNLHNWRQRTWKRGLAAAGVEYREPYGMRDTFATLTLTDGAPIEWIAGQLGHDELDTTLRHYARWQRVAEYRILDSLNAARAATGLKADSATGAGV